MSTKSLPSSNSEAEPQFYREFLAEREEILRHKYFLSENAGCDVGFDAALIDWVMQHRGKWIAARPERLELIASAN